MEKCIKSMQDAVHGVLLHSCMLPDDTRHQFWSDAWCTYKQDPNTFQNKHHHLHSVFYSELKPLFERLSARDLLFRCLHGQTQNQNESLNSVVWTRAPKSKFRGPKTVELAAISAVLEFNNGASAKYEVMEMANIPAGTHTMAGCIARDTKRIFHSKYKSQQTTQKCWEKQRQAVLEKESQAVDKDSYSTAAYNDLDPLLS